MVIEKDKLNPLEVVSLKNISPAMTVIEAARKMPVFLR